MVFNKSKYKKNDCVFIFSEENFVGVIVLECYKSKGCFFYTLQDLSDNYIEYNDVPETLIYKNGDNINQYINQQRELTESEIESKRKQLDCLLRRLKVLEDLNRLKAC